jgi:hypothetical protein
MEVLLIRQVQNETWKIMRYTQHQTIGIDRRFRQSLSFQARRQNEQAPRKERLEKEMAEKAGRPLSELDKMKQAARCHDVFGCATSSTLLNPFLDYASCASAKPIARAPSVASAASKTSAASAAAASASSKAATSAASAAPAAASATATLTSCTPGGNIPPRRFLDNSAYLSDPFHIV